MTAVVHAYWLHGLPMDPAAAPSEPLPPVPGFPFLHAGAGAVIVGPTGRGRSSLVQAMLYDAGQAGQSCAYLGSEVTSDEFNARAAALAERRGDLVDDDMRRRLADVRYLDLSATIAHAWSDPDAWLNLVAARYALVAIDPLSAAAAALDLDFDKANAEYIRFYDRLIQPLTAAGVAVVLVDNVGHAEDARARAKGASAKQDRADLTFSCSPSTTPPGLIVKAAKVRSIRASHQRGDEWLFLRDTQRIVRRERTAAASDQPASAFRPTNLMEKVSRAVEQHPGLSKRAIRTTIGGNAAAVDLALELLIAEEFIEVHKDSRGHSHHHLKPYRQLGDPGPCPTVSAPCPGRVPDTVPATVSDRVLSPVGGGPVTDTVSEDNGDTPTVSNNGHNPDAELDRLASKFEGEA
jgi:hypothetical protein